MTGLILTLLLLTSGPSSPDGLPPRPAGCLREACDMLVASQQPGGLFDPNSAAWWEAAYGVRALLAGHRVLGEPRYLLAAVRTLDAFVEQQEEDGGWSALERGRQAAPDSASRNLADLGTITACLSIAAEIAPEPRAGRYAAAHRRYLDSFASRHELPGGAYRNGLYRGIDLLHPYTIATATQAVSLAAAYRAGGDPLRLARAEAAARYLMRDWGEDGRPVFHPHDRPETIRPASTAFHDLYYILEALLWVHGTSADESLRAEIRATLRKYLYGEWGLLTQLGETVWYPPTAGRWAADKSNGMLGLLIEMREILGSERHLDRLIAGGTRALCAASTRVRYGVLVPPETESAEEVKIVSTAFAALSFAQCVRPGAAFGRDAAQAAE